MFDSYTPEQYSAACWGYLNNLLDPSLSYRSHESVYFGFCTKTTFRLFRYADGKLHVKYTSRNDSDEWHIEHVGFDLPMTPRQFKDLLNINTGFSIYMTPTILNELVHVLHKKLIKNELVTFQKEPHLHDFETNLEIKRLKEKALKKQEYFKNA